MADRPLPFSLGGPFAPPSEPATPAVLARLPVGRHGLPREFVEANQRNRLMAAAFDVFAQRGYAAGSVADIVKAAGVSRHTFYVHYSDKEACFLATYDVVIGWLGEQALAAAREADGWGRVAVAVIDLLTRLLAADPRIARLCTVEVFAAGPAAAGRHRALVDSMGRCLRAGRAADPAGCELPASLDSVLVGGAISVIGSRAIEGEGDRLTTLGPELSEALLTPYLGPAAARDLVAETS